MESDCTLQALTTSLKEIRDTEDSVLSTAKHLLKTDGREQFIDKGIGQLFKLAGTYHKAFERVGAGSKEKFNKIVKDNFRHEEIQDLEDEIHSLETQWDIFLKDIDKELEREGGPSLQVGQPGPVDVALIDARTNKSTTLHSYLSTGPIVLSQIISQRGSIMIVSFGVREGALRWLEDTKCQYPMLLDHKRQLYNLFGLKRSVYKTWSISCMIYYAEKMTQGVPLASPYENIHDDPQQMGGDFIMDKDGIMKYLYCSKLSSDRPTVADLIKQLESMK